MTIQMTTTRWALPALLLFLAACGGAEPPATPAPGGGLEAAAATITAADVAAKIGALAHDSARGRDTPSRELEEAAAYIEAGFRAAGLEPAGEDGTYIDRWDYEVAGMDPEGTYVQVADQPYSPRYEHDFFMVAGQQPVTEAGAFYAGVAGETGQLPSESRGDFLIFDVPGAEVGMEWQQKLVAAIQTAVFGGAAGVIVALDPEFPGAMIQQLADATASQQAPVPVVGVTDEAAQQLVTAAGADLDALRAAGQPADLDATLRVAAARTSESHAPPNVVALLPGSDPALRDTYVVLTAHFDHVGVGSPNQAGDSIYNGADDNASGTSALMEMAEAFAALPQAPARSVIFLAVSGEEKGLLGARAWVDEPTTVPAIDRVVANVNLDMVGRNAPDTIIGIGQEYSSLEGVLQRITDARPELGLNVILDPKPQEMFFFRSDQLPFIQEGIPAVFFTTSDHEDYHQPSDEPAKIDNEKVARVARLGFYLAHAIADDPTAPEWTEEGWERVESILQQSPF